MLPVLAAGATPLLEDLGVLVVAAALIAYISQRLGMIPIVGFLLSGILIGPNGLGLVEDLDLINQAADLGVILLLFTIGIEFSLSRLRQLALLILGGGSLQVGVTTGAHDGSVRRLRRRLEDGAVHRLPGRARARRPSC